MQIPKILKRPEMALEFLRAHYDPRFHDADLQAMVIGGKIWKAAPEDSPFEDTTTFQAVAKMSDTKPFFAVAETISIFDTKTQLFDIQSSISMHLSSSFREAAFHVESYDNRMSRYGLDAVMGGNYNAQPNLSQALLAIQARGLRGLMWREELACAGTFDAHRILGAWDRAPQKTQLIDDLNALRAG